MVGKVCARVLWYDGSCEQRKYAKILKLSKVDHAISMLNVMCYLHKICALISLSMVSFAPSLLSC